MATDQARTAVAGQSVANDYAWGWAVWSVTAAFGTYFCMYAFRKPFTAASFADVSAWGMSFKTVLVTAQVSGYMVSKFIGIKVIAEMPPRGRAAAILVLVAFAEAALLLFAVVPPPWNAACLFLNGLPLGMVYGLILGFLEGRRLTEALTAGLCASFILADGVTKAAGTWLLQWGVGQFWMPAVAGLVFVLPLCVCVGMLAVIPKPSSNDVVARSARTTMTRAQRWNFYARYATGLSLLVGIYLLVTILRSIRADFAPELWQGLGQPAQPSTFAHSELYVALGVLVVNGLSVLIVDNRRAFFGSLVTCAGGLALMAIALAGHRAGWLDGFAFMVLTGLGLYLPYVAMHTTVFERLLAMTREHGNLGFLMYVADAIGYLGYVAVMLSQDVLAGDSILPFFYRGSALAIILSALGLVGCWFYFAARPTPMPVAATEIVA